VKSLEEADASFPRCRRGRGHQISPMTPKAERPTYQATVTASAIGASARSVTLLAKPSCRT
jgi:hypothetical protein